MTASAFIARCRAVLVWLIGHPRVALFALAAVVALLLTCSLNRARNAEVRADAAEQKAASADERRQLDAQGFAVAAEKTKREMGAELAAALQGRDALAAEVERLKKTSPGARPVAVVHGETKPAPAPSDAAPRPAGPACLFAAGDLASADIVGVTMQTKAGNPVVLGAVDVWREKPEPRARLHSGLFEAPLTVAAVEKPEPKPEERAPGWALGGGAGFNGALAPLLAVSPPPWRVWSLQIETVASAGISPDGKAQASLVALVRW